MQILPKTSLSALNDDAGVTKGREQGEPALPTGLAQLGHPGEILAQFVRQRRHTSLSRDAADRISDAGDQQFAHAVVAAGNLQEAHLLRDFGAGDLEAGEFPIQFRDCTIKADTVDNDVRFEMATVGARPKAQFRLGVHHDDGLTKLQIEFLEDTPSSFLLRGDSRIFVLSPADDNVSDRSLDAIAMGRRGRNGGHFLGREISIDNVVGLDVIRRQVFFGSGEVAQEAGEIVAADDLADHGSTSLRAASRTEPNATRRALSSSADTGRPAFRA